MRGWAVKRENKRPRLANRNPTAPRPIWRGASPGAADPRPSPYFSRRKQVKGARQRFPRFANGVCALKTATPRPCASSILTPGTPPDFSPPQTRPRRGGKNICVSQRGGRFLIYGSNTRTPRAAHPSRCTCLRLGRSGGAILGRLENSFCEGRGRARSGTRTK